ncbi:MAG: VacB/RNase II family 3'-5' exoribonuclease [Spirochaetes bacterium]|nr:MAG: VacB/RNase II family 3'-5' exoribonuclease [Spirochaetota bacterium]
MTRSDSPRPRTGGPQDSSRHILAHIKQLNGPFTEQSLSAKISTESGQKKKSTKGRSRASRKGESRLSELLALLSNIGFLEFNRGKYTRTRDFRIQGTLRTDARGGGVLRTPDGTEFLVRREDTGGAHFNDEVIAELTDIREDRLCAAVTGVAKRKKERYLAQVRGKSKSQIHFVLIDQPGNIEVFAPRSPVEPNKGDLSIVKLTGRTSGGLQECEVDESYAPDDESLDLRRVMIKHSIPEPHGEYEELGAIDQGFITRERKGRKDFRKLRTITIDGKNAKDFDDAISLEKTRKGYTLYVHIADVSAFVAKGSPLDKEARARGTSFYLGNHVVPMLPEALSNDLCSLREGVERLVLSAEMSFDRSGAFVSSSFHRGIIKSDKRLTYEQAHDMVMKKGRDKLSKLLLDMQELAAILKKRRIDHGRVDLNLTDSEVVYEGNYLIDIISVQRLVSHVIVEEFMLSANEAVSRALRENAIPALFRVHESVSQEKLSALVKFLRTLGVQMNLKVSIGSALQSVIDQVRGREYEEVINFIILKSMMQAFYGVEPLGHFGLGFADYTHFTSPIRRYPDLIVHRCLKSLIAGSPRPYTLEELIPIGETSSTMERVAVNAERDLFKLKCCRLMLDRIGDEFDSVISSVARFGFFVTILERPIEGLVPLRFLTDDFYLVQEDEHTVIGKRLGKRFRLGDKVRVRLVSVEMETMRIDFELV